ncbi:MAG: bifunctional aconitate hydratase 2/2-methylisocitrate dehydratase [Sulfurovaceae bacterium]
MALIEDYKKHTEERAQLGVPPLPLNASQTAELVELLKQDSIAEKDYVLELFEEKVPAGVDDAAYVKAAFLNDIIQGGVTCEMITPIKACEILGKMLGGFNVKPLIEALKLGGEVGKSAANQLKNTLLVYDSFNDVKALMDEGNALAKEVIVSWAEGEWFTNRAEMDKEITVTVYKIPGETNTDDLSPASETGGIVIGDIIAPIFFNTAEDSGCIPIQAPVGKLETGDVITVKPFDGVIERDGEVVSEFTLEPNTLPDEMRAGGRIPLIIGKGLTAKAREALSMDAGDIFMKPAQPADDGKGYTLAQKMVGKACGMDGVKPGVYCEPIATTVGSQDTTGPMTRDEIKELAALNFGADFVLQSFCHTAAYPKPADINLQHTLPKFWTERKGFILRPGDGVIHSWLNRMCLPDTVGTGGDSHTRFPIGISFPAGSGLVAFAGVTGMMPLTMPESVLVRFKGKMQPGITLRDMVNAIPYQAIKDGLLTVEKKGKKNIFAGRVLEIEGLEDLKCEQAFELSDASAERSAAACTVKLNKEPVIEYLESNIVLIEELIAQGYEDKTTLERRAQKMRDWIADPVLMEADTDAQYAAVIEIDMDQIREPILACPNDPDDVKTLSEIHEAGLRTEIDEVFVGSCMTNIGLFRALGEVLRGEGAVPTKLWVCPPTKMDEKTLIEEGYYSVFGMAGARTEIPGCSLCMGNQASVAQNAWVFSTSTRNFDNRLGKGSQVYLGSAELAAVVALKGRIPTAAEYMEIVPNKIKPEMSDDVYRYLNFNKVSKEALEAMVE